MYEHNRQIQKQTYVWHPARALRIPEDDDSHPDFVAVGEITRLNGEIAKLHAFWGDMSRRHMRLIVRLLLDQGYRIAYIDRADGHVIPFATRITSGDWAGWWRLDLVGCGLVVDKYAYRHFSDVIVIAPVLARKSSHSPG